MTSAEFLTELRVLTARNITFFLDGNRLRYKPWHGVTESERSFIRANREQLKTIVREGLAVCPQEINIVGKNPESKQNPQSVPEPKARGCRETLWG